MTTAQFLIMQPVYLIDSSIYIFRSYFALPDNWQSYKGYSTKAVNGFCNYLFKFLEQINPTHVAAAFDESLKIGFRHQISPTYKANIETTLPCRRAKRRLQFLPK